MLQTVEKIDRSHLKSEGVVYEVHLSDLEFFDELGELITMEIISREGDKTFISVKGSSGVFEGYVRSTMIN